jgi:hypothetical protein
MLECTCSPWVPRCNWYDIPGNVPLKLMYFMCYVVSGNILRRYVKGIGYVSRGSAVPISKFSMFGVFNLKKIMM